MPDLTRKEVIIILATADRARLAGVDLAELNLAGLNFAGADLIRANLAGCNLTNA